MGVTNVSRESESRNEVANGSREMGSPKIKKIGGVCKGDPEGSNYLIKKLYEKYVV